MALNEVGQFFTTMFAQVWRVLSLRLPVFGFTILQFWVGVFIVELSIKIYRLFLHPVPFKSSSSGYYPRKGDKQ